MVVVAASSGGVQMYTLVKGTERRETLAQSLIYDLLYDAITLALTFACLRALRPHVI